MEVQRLSFGHVEHLDGEPALLRAAVHREPVERVINGTSVGKGKELATESNGV